MSSERHERRAAAQTPVSDPCASATVCRATVTRSRVFKSCGAAFRVPPVGGARLNIQIYLGQEGAPKRVLSI